MHLSSKDLIFDTTVDTVKLFVSVKTYYTIRVYKHKPQVGYVYLFATGNKQRIRINLDLEVSATDWNPKTGRLVENSKTNQDHNLILDNFTKKITDIRTVFRLTEKVLTPKLLERELKNGMVRVNFVAFFREALNEDKVNIRKGTYKKYNSIYEKLHEYAPEILFSELSISFFNKYRQWMATVKGNGKSTINGNIKIIKKYLALAAKYGIRLQFDLEELVGGPTAGHRDYLSPTELREMVKLYFRTKDLTLRIVLGNFLFVCMTGLRIGDLLDIDRKDIESNEHSFVNTKSDESQVIQLNLKAQEIVAFCPELFVKKFSEKHMNEKLKIAAALCGIEKTMTFHVGRHTFATCFLRKEVGGSVHHLQKLLKHKNISTTMVYVHILETEANEQVFALDRLFCLS